MLGTHSLALFATTVFVVNATPGVDMMLTLTRTLRYGVRGGLAAALGVMAGCVVHALAAALGLAALIAASAAAFSVLKWLGAAYLLWLAFGMLKSALAGVPGGPVYTYDQILADPHIKARRMVVEMDHPKIGRMKAMGIPVKSTGDLLEIREPAPWLGQHSDAVLRDLGYGAEVATLRFQ